MIERKTLRSHFENFETQRPFSYAVIDNFFPADLANQLSAEFPDFNDPVWHEYKNQIEIKKYPIIGTPFLRPPMKLLVI